MACRNLERLVARRGQQYGEPVLPQHVRHEGADAVVVFDEQNRFAAAVGGGRDHRRGLSQVRGSRQVNVERRPVPDAALHLDRAVVLLHDAIHRCQAETGALAVFLCREKRLEDPRQRVRVHSGSRVADRHLDVVAGLERWVGCDADLVELDVPQFDGDPSAARHSVARVNHEVHQYLLNLRRIRQHRREIGPHVRGDLNVRADHPLQHVLHVLHELIERNRLLGDHLTAAECEQLPRQSSRTLGGLDDFFGVGAPLVAVLEVLHAASRHSRG